MSPNPHFHRVFRREPALCCALIALLCGLPVPALAETAGPAEEDSLHIESSTCPHALLDDVQRFLHVELKSTRAASADSAPRVILSCSERVSLIRVLINGKESTRQLDLEGTDAALHARVIALAIAELLRDTARGEAVEPPPVAPALPPVEKPAPEPPPCPSVPARRPATSHLVAFARAENFGSSFQPLFGGGFSFSHELGQFSLGLGPTLATGERKVALGSVHVLAADLSVRLAYRFPKRAFTSEIGLGHALGLARLTGESSLSGTNADTVNGPWAGPFAFGTLDLNLAEPLFLEVAAELGVVTFPVRGLVAHGAAVEIAGLWSAASLGLGLNL
ncbi:MAG TPA: hypothetical protein VNW92_13740 [Polyangiaceae bacterium]|nr:hypothetical protein [Polyangiaceae bacterium]